MIAKTSAEKIREKAQQLKAKQAAAQETPDVTHPQQSTASAAPVLSKPVRSTLDLPPATHRDLQAWLGEAAIRLGRARVTKQDALNALVKLLLTDEVLAKKVLAELKERQ